ncbi:MAG: insulinase family protein [Deltaproteobacteria bacterium]|nr:insulinase family protein [Deltaproteobacteria bacterium]
MFQKTTFDNGVRLVTESLPHAYSVSLGLWVEVGSRDEEPELGGVSHLIEHMAFKGTAQLTALDIARVIDRLGGQANAFTGKESTCFHARALASHLPEMFSVLSEIFLHPAYDPAELERERQVILQEISCVEDTPDELVHVLFGLDFWPGHPLGRPILGTTASVEGMDRQAILDYMGANYVPANMVISAVGQLEHEHLVELLGPVVGALPTRPARPPRHAPLTEPRLRVVSRPTEQVHVLLGADAPSAVAPQRFAAALMNGMLGGSMSSRLFQEVRERRGLAYAVYSYLSSYSDTGMLGVYLGVSPSRTVEAIQVVKEEMAAMASGLVDAEELEHAKEHLKGSILLGAENPDSRMSRLAKNEFYFGGHVPLDQVIANIDAVEAAEVSALAGQILDPDRLAVTVLGNLDADRVAQELLA